MASSSPIPLTRLSLERRPKLLKDFLQDDPYSCSSNDFGSHPRKLCKSTSSNFHGSRITSKDASSQLLRSRSSRAATATISAFNKVINIVKFLPFSSVKSPSILPRSISRKLSRRNNYKENKKHCNQDVSVTVKVKDILRWKSFRDLADEKSTPLNSSSYTPYRCTTTANSTTTTSSNTSSKRSSWCDSDFTAEDLPSWWGENGEFLGELEDGMKKVGRNNLLDEGVGGYKMQTTRASRRDTKEELCFDENEQHTPVSVLESPFQDDDEEGIMSFSFHQGLANLEQKKSMLMQRIQQFESLVEGGTISFKEEELAEKSKEDEDIQEIEEKAKQLLSHLKETNNFFMGDNYENELLFDFFWHELCTSGNRQNYSADGESEKLMREAKSWINGEYIGEFEWEIEDNREAYIKDMERVVRWNKFEEEKQELSFDLEFEVFNDLIHEILEDVLFT